jgi:Kef-type K+ transport system membrane component KefB/nucleotide-binding universal stress UspA family protein
VNLNPPTEHQLLVFWVALLVILVAARALGALMQKVGQPAVVGELAAGLVLGPSLLGNLAPDVTDWLFPADDAQTAMLFTVGWLGVLLLLVGTGFETDLGLIQRLGRAAFFVSAGSLIVPAAAGFAVGWFIPTTFVGDDTERYIFALFIAAALSISSLPVIAKILSEMGLMRRNFGQLTLAAGMANDVIGWIGLGFIAGLAQAGGVKLDKLAFTVVGVTVFFVLAFTIGQRVVDASLRRVRANGGDALSGLTVVLITALSFGVITQWLHVEAVLGAFIAGVILARSRFADHELIRPLETMTAAIFAPIFFATAGLRVDLGLLADGETIVWAVVVVLAASFSKFFGSLAGARLSFIPTREGLALGVGLNARGALEIVIATVGLSLGVLNDRSYTVVVLMAMATSMAAPPMLRRVLRNWEGTPEERRRLDLESQLAANTVVRGGRVLIPTRGGMSSLLAAQVADLVWPDDTEVTLFTVGDGPAPDLTAHFAVLHHGNPEHEQVAGDDVAETILAEARLGYDAIVVGTGDKAGALVTPEVDELLRRSPIPVVIVRSAHDAGGRLPWAFARAVVPVNGARSSRPAQELGAYLSARIGTHLHHLHVTTETATRFETILGEYPVPRSPGRGILNEAAALASTAGANFSSRVEHATNPGEQIATTARELDADLVIVSGTSRTNDGNLSVGHTIQHVLDNTESTLIVALTPETAGTDDQAAAESAVESSQPAH